MNWTLQTVPISKLQEWEGNPRKISPEDLEHLKQSFLDFGHARTLTVSPEEGKYVIIGGNQSKKALKELGIKEIQCSVSDRPLTENEKRTLSIRLNHRNKGEGEWDVEILNTWDDIDLEFEGIEIPDIKIEASEDDYEVPEHDEIKTDIVLGDLIEIGQHRLLCGDSTDSDQVATLMNGEKADMVFTDPPYNINYGNIKHPKFKQREIKNDNMGTDEFVIFCRSFMSIIVIYNKGCVYISGPPSPDGRAMFMEADKSLHYSTVIIWNKDQFTLGRGKYQNKYEPIWFGWVDNGTSFYADRKQTNVWDIERPKKSEQHPTMKPVELISRAINHASRKYDLIFDLFLGSGSTMVAAHQLNRKCYGMELDPKYCQVIIDRMLKLDPDIEIKVNGIKYQPNGL